MGDVVAVEVDRALVAGRQTEARCVAAGEHPVRYARGAGGWMCGEVLGEARRPGKESKIPGSTTRRMRSGSGQL